MKQILLHSAATSMFCVLVVDGLSNRTPNRAGWIGVGGFARERVGGFARERAGKGLSWEAFFAESSSTGDEEVGAALVVFVELVAPVVPEAAWE